MMAVPSFFPSQLMKPFVRVVPAHHVPGAAVAYKKRCFGKAGKAQPHTVGKGLHARPTSKPYTLNLFNLANEHCVYAFVFPQAS